MLLLLQVLFRYSIGKPLFHQYQLYLHHMFQVHCQNLSTMVCPCKNLPQRAIPTHPHLDLHLLKFLLLSRYHDKFQHNIHTSYLLLRQYAIDHSSIVHHRIQCEFFLFLWIDQEPQLDMMHIHRKDKSYLPMYYHYPLK